MVAIIAIVVIALIIYMISKEKKKPNIIVEEENPVCLSDSELSRLAVFYKGKLLSSGEVINIPYNEFVEFYVEGYSLKNKCVSISGIKIKWGRSCSCTHWQFETGLTNKVRTNNKSLNIKRNVWVKYSNGVTFGWKVEVV